MHSILRSSSVGVSTGVGLFGGHLFESSQGYQRFYLALKFLGLVGLIEVPVYQKKNCLFAIHVFCLHSSALVNVYQLKKRTA